MFAYNYPCRFFYCSSFTLGSVVLEEKLRFGFIKINEL